MNGRTRATSRWAVVLGLFVSGGCGKPPEPAVPGVSTVRSAVSSNPWTKLANGYPGGAPGPVHVALLTDGSVLASDIEPHATNEPAPFVGTDTSNHWFRLRPSTTGSYANGTWSQMASSNLGRAFNPGFVLRDGRYILCGGEYVTDRYELASHPLGKSYARCEIYDPIANSWTEQAQMPIAIRDSPAAEIDPATGGSSRVFVVGAPPNPFSFSTSTGWSAPLAAYDTSAIDNEGDCLLLQTGNVFCGLAGFSTYSPAGNNWTPAMSPPVLLQSAGINEEPEIGPFALLYSGEVMVLGANSDATNQNADSAIFNPATGTWRMATAMPSSPLPYDHGDTPATVMKDGRVLVTSFQDGSSGVGILHEYDPTVTPNTWTAVPNPTSGFSGAGSMRLLDLPNGQVLVTGTDDGSVWLYTPNGTPQSAWRPTITSISAPSGGQFTLTGTQLNGLTNGADYGDDAKMATNYPIVYLTSGTSLYYARSFNFGKMTPGPSVSSTCNFTLPPALPDGNYQVHVAANGLDSGNTLGLIVVGPHVTAVNLTDPLHGTVVLDGAPGSNTTITLHSSDTSAITVPATVTIPAGSTSVNFTATKVAFGSALVTANVSPTNAQFQAVTVRMGWTLESLTGPSVVYGDRAPASTVTWTVGLSAAAPSGATVNLSSAILPLGNTLVATVPTTVTVPSGSTTATFAVTRTGNRGLAKITASIKGTTRTFTYSDRDTDFFKCAAENGSCATPTTSQRLIAFGANGSYTYLLSSGASTPCNTATFGDPAPGVSKNCYLSAYALLTADGGSTTLSTPTEAAWGADTGYAYGRQAPGSFSCNPQSFVTAGNLPDPVPGLGRSCFAGPDQAFYTYRGDEGATLQGLASAPIAYGAAGRFVFQVVGGTVTCNNSTFGDPAPGFTKSCYTLAYPRLVADEGATLYLPQGTPVVFGSGLNGNYLTTTISGATPTCSTTFFGGDPDPGQTKHCWVKENAGRTFQEVDTQHVYVVGGDKNLWLEQGPFGTVPPSRQLVDWPVLDIQAMTATDVFVRGMDGNLWFEHAPFGSPPPAREQVDSGAVAFQAIDSQHVLVLQNDQSLWLDTAPFGAPNRQQVDGTVTAFAGVNASAVYVLGFDGNLWFETAPFGAPPPTRQLVDSNVQAIQAVDTQHVYAMRTDRTLWLEQAPFGTVPPPGAVQIDAGIDSFAAIDAQHVVVLGPDGNLWLTPAPFGTIPDPSRIQIDAGVVSFQAIDLQHMMALDGSGNLWLEQAPFGSVPPTRQQVDAFVPPFGNAGH